MTGAESARRGATCAGSRTCVTRQPRQRTRRGRTRRRRPSRSRMACSRAYPHGLKEEPQPSQPRGTTASVDHDEHPRSHLASHDPHPTTQTGVRGSRCCSLKPSLINCKSSDSVTTNPLDSAGKAQPRWKPMPKNVCDDNMRTMRPPASSPPTTWAALQVTTQGVVQQLERLPSSRGRRRRCLRLVLHMYGHSECSREHRRRCWWRRRLERSNRAGGRSLAAGRVFG